MIKMEFICKNCGKTIIDNPSRRRTFCSYNCQGAFLKNKPFSGISNIEKQFTKGHNRWNHSNAIENQFKKGRIPWNKGKQGIFSIENLKRLSILRKGKTYEEIYGINKAKENKEKISKSVRKLWSDKDFVRKAIKNFMKKPNKTEQFLIELMKQNNLPFRYVGDGEFIIGRKCPDFMNVNGKKQVIEFFGDYWHDSNRKNIPFHQTEAGTIEHYKKYGFDCLIIKQKELKDLNNLTSRIERFINNNNRVGRI